MRSIFRGLSAIAPVAESACLKPSNQRIVLNSRELSSVYEELGQVIALTRVELEGASRACWGGVALFSKCFLLAWAALQLNQARKNGDEFIRQIGVTREWLQFSCIRGEEK